MRGRGRSSSKAKILLPAFIAGVVLGLLIVSTMGGDDSLETEVLGVVEQNVEEETGEPARIEITRCDVLDEQLEIVNSGGRTINLAGWILHDDGRVWETDLGDVTLGPGESIVLLSGDQALALPGMYRWTVGNVWNNRGGDVATLIRSDGLVVETFDCT